MTCASATRYLPATARCGLCSTGPMALAYAMAYSAPRMAPVGSCTASTWPTR